MKIWGNAGGSICGLRVLNDEEFDLLVTVVENRGSEGLSFSIKPITLTDSNWPVR